MIDAYEIGITLALENGVSEGLAVIRRDLQVLDQAIAVTTQGLAGLARMAQVSLPAVPSAVVGPVRPAVQAVQGAVEAVQAAPAAVPKREESGMEAPRPAPAVAPAVPDGLPRAGRDRGPIGAAAVPAAPREIGDAAPVRTVTMRVPAEVTGPPVIRQGEAAVPVAVPPPQAVQAVTAPAGLGPRRTEVAEGRGAPGPAANGRVVVPESVRPASPGRDDAVGPRGRGSPERRDDGPARVVRQPAVAAGSAPRVSRTVTAPVAEVLRRDPWPEPRTEGRRAAAVERGVAPLAAAPMRRTVGRDAERPAAPPAQAGTGGPIGGDVYLDGAKVGRWMSEELGRVATRPPSGPTGFDPLMSPGWGPFGAG